MSENSDGTMEGCLFLTGVLINNYNGRDGLFLYGILLKSCPTKKPTHKHTNTNTTHHFYLTTPKHHDVQATTVDTRLLLSTTTIVLLLLLGSTSKLIGVFFLSQ